MFAKQDWELDVWVGKRLWELASGSTGCTSGASSLVAACDSSSEQSSAKTGAAAGGGGAIE